MDKDNENLTIDIKIKESISNVIYQVLDNQTKIIEMLEKNSELMQKILRSEIYEYEQDFS